MVFPSHFIPELSPSPIGFPGQSVYHSGSLPRSDGVQHPQVNERFRQSEFDTATSNMARRTPTVVLHEYRRCPGTEDHKMEGWFTVPMIPALDGKALQCTWPGCTSTPFTRNHEAYTCPQAPGNTEAVRVYYLVSSWTIMVCSKGMRGKDQLKRRYSTAHFGTR